MSKSVKVTGLKKLEKSFKDLEKKANSLGGEVSFDKLFHHPFMVKHTKVSSFDEFLEQGDFHVESQEDFEAIPDAEFDEYVRISTHFSSWQEMLDSAAQEYVNAQLF